MPLLLASGCDIEKYWLVSATPERNVRSSEAEAEVLVEDSRTKAKRKDDTMMLFQEDRKRGKREDERGARRGRIRRADELRRIYIHHSVPFEQLLLFDKGNSKSLKDPILPESYRRHTQMSAMIQLVVMHNTLILSDRCHNSATFKWHQSNTLSQP